MPWSNYNVTYTDLPQNKYVKKVLGLNQYAVDVEDKGEYVPTDLQPEHINNRIFSMRKSISHPGNEHMFGEGLDRTIKSCDRLTGSGHYGHDDSIAEPGMISSTFSRYPVHMSSDKPEIIPNRSWGNYTDKMFDGYDVYKDARDDDKAGRMVGGYRPRDFVLPQYDRYLYTHDTPYSVMGAGIQTGRPGKLGQPMHFGQVRNLDLMDGSGSSGGGASGGDIWGDIWSGVKDAGTFINNNAIDTVKNPETRHALIDLGMAAVGRGVDTDQTERSRKMIGLPKPRDRIMGHGVLERSGGGASGGDIWGDIWNGTKQVLSDPEVKTIGLNLLSDAVRARRGGGVSGGGSSGGMNPSKQLVHYTPRDVQRGSGSSGGGASGGDIWGDIWNGTKQVLSDPEVKTIGLNLLSDAVRARRGGGVSGGAKKRGRPHKALTEEPKPKRKVGRPRKNMTGEGFFEDLAEGAKDAFKTIGISAKEVATDPYTYKALLEAAHGGGSSGGAVRQQYAKGLIAPTKAQIADMMNDPTVHKYGAGSSGGAKKKRGRPSKKMQGEGIFDDIWSGIKKTGSTAASVGKSALSGVASVGKEVLSDPEVKKFLINEGLNLAKDAIKSRKASTDTAGAGRKKGAGLLGKVPSQYSGERGGALEQKDVNKKIFDLAAELKKVKTGNHKEFPIHSAQTSDKGYDKKYVYKSHLIKKIAEFKDVTQAKAKQYLKSLNDSGLTNNQINEILDKKISEKQTTSHDDKYNIVL